MVAGGILVEQAIDNTMVNLRRAVPAVASVAAIDHSVDTTSEIPMLNRETIHAVGALSHVSHFDYSVIYEVFGYFSMYVLDGLDMGVPRDFNLFRLFGVSRPEVIYIENGMYELFEGRLFTEAEINPSDELSIAPILVSREFAELNGLSLGSTIDLFHHYFELPDGANLPEDGLAYLTTLEELWAHPYNNWIEFEYEFEIVGIFNFTRSLRGRDWDLLNHQSMINLVFTPNWRADEMRRRRLESNIEQADTLNVHHLVDSDPEMLWREQELITPFWVLYDFAHVDDFVEQANALLLPYYLEIEDLSGTFGGMITATDNLNTVVGRILWLGFGAIVIVLSLLIILYLRDRQYELGVYLALGEKKLKIILQLLTEVISVSLVGLIFAFAIGVVVSEEISLSMLRAELAANARDEHYWPSMIELVGFGQEMTPEEMLEAFNVSLSVETTLLFFAVGLGTVILSTIVPVAFILELNPKDILMKAKIE